MIRGFCSNAVRSGVDIMRIFDALNDPDNMASSIRFVKEAGGLADCALCYTTDPPFTRGQRLAGFLKGQAPARGPSSPTVISSKRRKPSPPSAPT